MPKPTEDVVDALSNLSLPTSGATGPFFHATTAANAHAIQRTGTMAADSWLSPRREIGKLLKSTGKDVEHVLEIELDAYDLALGETIKDDSGEEVPTFTVIASDPAAGCPVTVNGVSPV